MRYDNVSAALVLSDANSHQRYVFRADVSGNNTGTCRDNDVSGSNQFEDQSYPGVPWTQNAWHEVEVSTQISGGYIEVLEYCNESNCNSTPRTFTTYGGISALVPAFTSWNVGYDLYTRLIFVRRYTAYSVTATVN